MASKREGRASALERYWLHRKEGRQEALGTGIPTPRWHGLPPSLACASKEGSPHRTPYDHCLRLTGRRGTNSGRGGTWLRPSGSAAHCPCPVPNYPTGCTTTMAVSVEAPPWLPRVGKAVERLLRLASEPLRLSAGGCSPSGATTSARAGTGAAGLAAG